MKVEVGDWIRFMQGGKLVIGVVNYITESVIHTRYAETDIGQVHVDYVLEVRRPEARS